MILTAGSPIPVRIPFKIPLFIRITIHAYVRIRKFIHIGSIISITRIFCVLGLVFDIQYAIG
jgi:hypothetical protein